MLDWWVQSCLSMSERPAEFYSGARKIIRRVRLIAPSEGMDTLTLADCGYTKSKMSMLHRNYYVEASIDAAVKLWDSRLQKKKYGSVGFTCYGHYVKGNIAGKSPRGSVMGPCIQGVTLTLTEKRTTSVDLFYRTTELFKKFPADLVFLREQLLTNFDFTQAPIKDIAFHFANVTCHPMYAVTFLPHLYDPVLWLTNLKKLDPYFHDWVVKWTARYICDEYGRGIQKFSQALRVQKDALERLTGSKMRKLQKYVRDNHPGYRGDIPEDEDDTE